jgi:hypothetical protein
VSTIHYYYTFPTVQGIVSIIPAPQGRFRIMFGEDDLGSYATPEQAASDVSGGHTDSPSNGVDLGELGIPDDLGSWHRKVFAEIGKLKPV